METNSSANHSSSDAVFTSRIDFSDLRSSVEQLREGVHKILVGQDEMVDLLMAALLANGHVLIEGVPGVAKTLTARLMARTLSVEFTRIQFTPDLMPSDIIGTSIFNPEEAQFTFKPGPIFTNVALIDEINRAPAKTQAALFEVMEERQVSFDGTTHRLDAPFIVFATQNPLEHEGTYRLPEAQLDRFLFKIEVGYPSIDDEVRILAGHHAGHTPERLDEVQPVLTAESLDAYRAQVRQVHIEDDLIDYIARLVHRTRNHDGLLLGASPRASVALMNGAKALAAMRGRDFVSPEDVQRILYPVLRHRVLLTPEQEMEGRRTDDIIKRIVEQVEVPR